MAECFGDRDNLAGTIADSDFKSRASFRLGLPAHFTARENSNSTYVHDQTSSLEDHAWKRELSLGIGCPNSNNSLQ